MRLEENLAIKKQNPKDKIYCSEDYALDAYNMYQAKSFFVRKDLTAGELVNITGIAGIKKNEIYFEVNNSANVPIDINKEKRFLELHGIDTKSFIKWISTKEGKEEFVKRNHQIKILESTPNLRSSLIAGYAESMKQEFLEQLKNPKTAYEAKIIGKNQGGFLVDVCGVQAFLPGGLAAANKINNFDDYIGKKVKVMIEDYLSDIQTYIVSHKKYLDCVLPSLIEDYDWTKQHTGIVTGSNKYGIFVEFYELFTGLLHTSKMTQQIKEMFDKHQIKTGSEITCWIREKTNSNRLVLTNYEPGSEDDKIKIHEIHSGKVTGVKEYGVFVKLKSGESGLIPKSDVKREYNLNETVRVEVTNIKDDKLFFVECNEQS